MAVASVLNFKQDSSQQSDIGPLEYRVPVPGERLYGEFVLGKTGNAGQHPMHESGSRDRCVEHQVRTRETRIDSLTSSVVGLETLRALKL